MNDTLQSLLFQTSSCRAHLVTLEKTWQKIASHNAYPIPVLDLLGELVAASVMLSASLKFEGSLILQIKGDGPVVLLVAECNNRLGVRATVKLNENLPVKADAGFQDLVNAQGKGMFAVILDPKNRQPGQLPYQGIVPLEGHTVAQSLESYMKTSEQLETRLVLHANGLRATGLMLQQMPLEGGKQSTNLKHDPDGWERLTAIAQTLQKEENLNTPLDTLIHRLFWEENPELLAERTPVFECTCSRHKVARMLFRLGQKEINEALETQHQITIHCDFCNSAYIFTAIQCAHLFEETELEEALTDEETDTSQDVCKDIYKEDRPPTLH